MIEVTRRGFLIGTAGVVATAAIAPRLILPEPAVVANAQGIFVEFHPLEKQWIERGSLATSKWEERMWVLPYARIKFPMGRMERVWADADEVKADARRLQFQSDTNTGEFAIWAYPVAPAERAEPRVPNFIALVRT